MVQWGVINKEHTRNVKRYRFFGGSDHCACSWSKYRCRGTPWNQQFTK